MPVEDRPAPEGSAFAQRDQCRDRLRRVDRVQLQALAAAGEVARVLGRGCAMAVPGPQPARIRVELGRGDRPHTHVRAAAAQQSHRAAGQARDRPRVDRRAVVDDHSHHAGAQAGDPKARRQARRRAARPERHDHVRGLGELAARDLLRQFERALHVAQATQRRGPAHGQEVGQPAGAEVGVAQEDPGRRQIGAVLAAGPVDAGAGAPDALQLAAHVVVERLVDERQRRAKPPLAPPHRRGQPMVRRQPADRHDRPPPARLHVGQDPLQLADLVAAVGAPYAPSSFSHTSGPGPVASARRRRTGDGASPRRTCGIVSRRAGKRSWRRAVTRRRARDRLQRIGARGVSGRAHQALVLELVHDVDLEVRDPAASLEPEAAGGHERCRPPPRWSKGAPRDVLLALELVEEGEQLLAGQHPPTGRVRDPLHVRIRERSAASRPLVGDGLPEPAYQPHSAFCWWHRMVSRAATVSKADATVLTVNEGSPAGKARVGAMRRLDLRRHAPVIVIVLLVVAPLAIWAATSGGSGEDDKQGLIVERGVSITGEPELVLSIAGNMQVTSGVQRHDRVRGQGGKVLIKGTQSWPFIEEPGIRTHMCIRRLAEKVEGARRCRVLGTDTRLEAKGGEKK